MKIRVILASAALTVMSATAAADELTSNTVLDAFDRGGKIMWAILLVSIIGCAFVAERLIVLRRGAQIPKRLMTEMRDAMVRGGVATGRKTVEGGKSAMARVMYALLSRSGATRRELEGVLDDEATRILFDLRCNLRPIGIVASIAPMLGLLGTVFGLIAAFRAAAELGMDDPRNFAAGIYEALYTTAFGLVVAIPLLIAYNLLRTRSDLIMREVEERALAFIADASNRAASAPTFAARPEMDDDDFNDFAGDEDTQLDDSVRTADSDETNVEEV